jgi:hypothetical protein
LGSARHGVIASVVALLVIVAADFGYAMAQQAGGGAAGGQREVEVGDAGKPVVYAAAADGGSITLDGRLDEPAWTAARPATAFVQREPEEGVSPDQSTEVRVVFDDAALYVGARMFDEAPGSIARQLVRRDAFGAYDYFEVAVDPNLDRRSGYSFRVSADNVQRDVFLFDDSRSDDAWDAVWESAVGHDSLGWLVELRIPFSQVRYEASGTDQVWGVHFARRRLASNELTHLGLISRTQEGVVSQFATLSGLRLRGGNRRLELRPFVLTRASRGPAELGDPFFDGSDLSATVGGEVRYGLGTQFTLDATFNPDFGQVEADPAVINLTAFETFFEERRPFFVEDARVFDFSLSGRQNQLFYSRRIGRSPRGEAPDEALFADEPTAATILGAAKLTGRTSGGLSVGGLAALTRNEHGRAFLTGPGAVDYLAEPRTAYGVLRARQDFAGGASTIGVIGTVLRRGLPDDGSFAFLPTSAFSVGLDWEYQWNDREWAYVGYVAASHVRGDTAAIGAIQRSSDHYFQRPDSRWVSLDPTAASLSGIDWRMTLERRRAEHWTGSVWLAEATSGFEVDDLGFSNRQEVLDAGARISYRELDPGEHLRSYRASVFTFHNWSHDALDDPRSADSWGRAHVAGSVSGSIDVELLNYWEIDTRWSWRPELSDRNATRGGPLMLRPSSWEAELGLQTDRRKRFNVGSNMSYERSDLDAGSSVRVSLEASLRPSSRIEVEVEPSWRSSRTAAQYVTTSESVPFGPTLGDRYLFGDLERRELGLETRIDVAFSPYLSLQLFAQPLLSAGHYRAYKQLLAPGSFSFDVFAEGVFEDVGTGPVCAGGRTCVDDEGERYVDFDGDGTVDDAFDDREFNVRSLVGNAVLRWEYRPGSTVFFVWQRQQENRGDEGDFELGRDAGALFDSPAEDVFMVKINLWLGL